ncbi:hypothetical protein K488DRAFT_85783 [Vararia minispora EC-137]|uniref:Uncharacterized protein n=1 Tax=Vararia minispora EC-137 TaxID=1314806 RepID=A0ACB8QLE4_9AGAM|nr:hypothetical protein K488DRAFT_85783 [Vararia minispora EC-137]
MPYRFTVLPPEIMEYAFTFADPVDIAAVNQTCKTIYNVTAPLNTHFWRTLYLCYPFDDPRTHFPDAAETFNWRYVFTSRIRAERFPNDIAHLLVTVADCLRTLPPHSSVLSADLAWVERIVCERREIFHDEWPPTSACSSEDGVEDQEDSQVDLAIVGPIPKESRMFIRASLCRLLRPELASAAERRRAARSFVYDLRNYVETSVWGPLMPGARAPCWKHIDALISVISANLGDFGFNCPEVLKPPTLRYGAEALRAYSAVPGRECSTIDWAGISGEWMRIHAHVPILKISDLIRFNRNRCSPDFFYDGFQEATRMLRMHLVVTGIADEFSADPARPALRFEGKTRAFASQAGLERSMRGVVRVMPSGDIRWSWVSSYQGEEDSEEWCAEGIQLGGPGSAAGVIGTWTGALHEAGTPALCFGDDSIFDSVRKAILLALSGRSEWPTRTL